jgi:hypothetical protein
VRSTKCADPPHPPSSESPAASAKPSTRAWPSFETAPARAYPATVAAAQRVATAVQSPTIERPERPADFMSAAGGAGIGPVVAAALGRQGREVDVAQGIEDVGREREGPTERRLHWLIWLLEVEVEVSL